MSEKLTVLVPVKMSESMHADLLKVCGGVRDRAKWIRARIVEAIARAKEEKALRGVTRDEARAIAEARALKIDPVAAIRAAIAGKLFHP